jgi:Zn finger protein HypA/HybF involved in hydrogenase expression
LSVTLCQCDKCHRVYPVDSVRDRMICPACRAQTSQTCIINLPSVEVI